MQTLVGVLLALSVRCHAMPVTNRLLRRGKPLGPTSAARTAAAAADNIVKRRRRAHTRTRGVDLADVSPGHSYLNSSSSQVMSVADWPGSIVEIPACKKHGSTPVYNIWISTAEQNIILSKPVKKRLFAKIIPGYKAGYVYKTEEEYYRGYSESAFAITMKKGGYDCERHYEILAQGTVPYFIDWENYTSTVSAMLPRDLITSAMNLPGMPSKEAVQAAFHGNDTSTLKITGNEDSFWQQYNEIWKALHDYTKRYLTARYLSRYVKAHITSVRSASPQNILYISSYDRMDYVGGFLYLGFKQDSPTQFWEYFDQPWMYDCAHRGADGKGLYGKGFSYCGRLDKKLRMPDSERLDAIKMMNAKGQFDTIIYTTVGWQCGGVRDGIDFVSYVNDYLARFPTTTVIHVDGGDIRSCHDLPGFKKIDLIFTRETCAT